MCECKGRVIQGNSITCGYVSQGQVRNVQGCMRQRGSESCSFCCMLGYIHRCVLSHVTAQQVPHTNSKGPYVHMSQKAKCLVGFSVAIHSHVCKLWMASMMA